MTEEVLNKIEELINKYDEHEIFWSDEGDEEMEKWALNHKMGLFALLQEFGYDYKRDKNGRLKIVHNN